MLESFKMNCPSLQRIIRITVYLPMQYNNVSRYYPAFYLFDGQNAFSAKDSYSGKSLDLLQQIPLLEQDGKEAIYIAVSAAIDENVRKQEYKNKDLTDFLLRQIHPYIVSRYRINSYVYAVGCGKAAQSAWIIGCSPVAKGAILLSPEGTFESQPDLPKDRRFYLYAGTKEANGQIEQNVHQIHSFFNEATVLIDDNEIHHEDAWKTILPKALSSFIF